MSKIKAGCIAKCSNLLVLQLLGQQAFCYCNYFDYSSFVYKEEFSIIKATRQKTKFVKFMTLLWNLNFDDFQNLQIRNELLVHSFWYPYQT